MPRDPKQPDLIWIQADDPLPSPDLAWNAQSPAPGLLAAGHDLSVSRLVESYRNGIFPWFSADQPVLWWSPDPRMVLKISDFRFHRSLQLSLKRWQRQPGFSLSFDRDFGQVMRRCSSAPRPGQNGTWILEPMVSAYEALHRAGHAHSAEVWLDGELVAGLYFVALGHAVFGESMFTTVRDGSKMALAALVSVCRKFDITAIDCQQNTRHLASMGAREVPRADFLKWIEEAQRQTSIDWSQQTLYWDTLTAMDTAL